MVAQKQETKISAADRDRIAELRSLVKEDLSTYYDTDFNLLRWLNDTDGSVEVVAEKLKVHLELRNSVWRLDEIHKIPRNAPPVRKYTPSGLVGRSGVLKNVIVQVEQSGRIDQEGLFRTFSILDVVRTASIPDCEYLLREVMDVEAETGEQGSVMFIFDLSELKYSMKLYGYATGYLRSAGEYVDQHYPDLITHIVVVNVPIFVYAIWKALRPLLPAKIREKVVLLSPSNWRQEIVEYADPSILPAVWNTKSNNSFTGELISPIRAPKEGYVKVKIPKGVQKMHIPHGQTTTVYLHAKEGQYLNFWLMSDGTFASSIHRSEEENEEDLTKMDAVYPSFGWICGPFYVPLTQSFQAEKTGWYRFWYSNQRAWFHNVTVTAHLAATDEPLYQ